MLQKTANANQVPKQHNLHLGECGFTLVELMIALVLSLFLIGGAVLISTSGKATYTDSDKLSRTQESIRFASDFLVRDIRNAGFWDRISLTLEEAAQIQEKYAAVADGGKELTIRYTGRGHCTENFENFRVVENQYSLKNGELQCAGRSVDATTDPDIESADLSTPIGLISGVSALSFELIGPAEGTPCIANIRDETNTNPCLGVKIGLQFESVRDLENPGTFEQRYVELLAAFRNISLLPIFRT